MAAASPEPRRSDFPTALPEPNGTPARRIPHDTALDASVAFMRDGYLFITKRCERLGSERWPRLLEPLATSHPLKPRNCFTRAHIRDAGFGKT